jgi:hypothetical protein
MVERGLYHPATVRQSMLRRNNDSHDEPGIMTIS